jgi:phage terminase large subunit
MAKKKVNKKLSEIVTKSFNKFWVESKKKEFLYYVLKGGRGSGKSFHIPLRVVLDVMEYPVSALAVRKVQNTIVKSVYANIEAATIVLGVHHLFKFVPSRLEIVYKPRGNRIYFAGADDPEKIKSIKDAKFPLAILWIEELAEFKTEDEVSSIENSVLREELEGNIVSEAKRKKAYPFNYTFYYSYNPPKRKQSWVNKKYDTKVDLPANTFVHHSTYLDNPHLSKRFIENAENVKKKNPMKYRWEYMGEAIGSGVVPFDNLVFRAISDAEFAAFDNTRQGNDWGYANDPNAWVRWHYDKKKRTIYAMDEIYKVKLHNRELAKEIIKRKYHDEMTTADGSEPKSVDEVKEYGVKIKGAVKGPGSVEHGEKWLDELDAIVIDPKRTPEIAREFENIDYAVDRNGKPLTKLADEDNHAIDATRYAFEDDMQFKGKLRAARRI